MTKPPILCCVVLILIGILGQALVAAPTAAVEDEPAASTGSVYFVAATGSDSNPGTEARPWRTVQKAADTLVAGDTVYIRAGTYHEQVVPQNSGSADNYITYAAYPGETVTIDGSSVTLSADFAGLFEISHKSYIRVSGLRAINAGPLDNNAGILVDVSHHIIVEHNYTYNTASSGIGVWASDDVTIAGNTIEHCCTHVSQECLTVAETDWFEVKDNEVFDSPQEGIIVKDNSSNGKVYRNHVHHVGSTGLYVDSWNRYTHDVEVFQNVVHDVEDNGFAVGSEDGGTLENVRIYNNIAYNNRYVGLSVSANGLSGPMQDIYIVNNTFYNNGTDWGGGILVENPNAQNVVIRNNIASQNLSFQIADEAGLSTADLTVDHNLIDGYRDYGGELRGSDYVEGDPLFVNPSRADFHLQPGSPAIDVGSAVDAPDDDFDGTIRPQDGDDDGSAAFDIGAYEAGSQRVYLPFILRDS